KPCTLATGGCPKVQNNVFPPVIIQPELIRIVVKNLCELYPLRNPITDGQSIGTGIPAPMGASLFRGDVGPCLRIEYR
ncbi:hypothetical protein ACWKSR_12380, partial [Campylobacter fetus subsp. venerealis]